MGSCVDKAEDHLREDNRLYLICCGRCRKKEEGSSEFGSQKLSRVGKDRTGVQGSHLSQQGEIGNVGNSGMQANGQSEVELIEENEPQIDYSQGHL